MHVLIRVARWAPSPTRRMERVLAWLLAAGLVVPAFAADVAYTLRHAPGLVGAEDAVETPDAGSWIVEVGVTGADSRDGPLRFTLDDFGGWDELRRPYVELIEAHPEPSRRDVAAGMFEFPAPSRGDDPVRLVYRIPLLPMHGADQRARGLLPAGGEAYAFGWSRNVLAQVSDDSGPVRGARTLELIAPDGMSIVTGWSGESVGRQRATLDAAMGNGPIAFGVPAFRALDGRAGFAVEVYQYGAGGEIADVVADVLLSASPRLGALFGRPARNPYRAFVTDHQGGGMGSHFGLRVAHTRDDPPEQRTSPWFAAFVLHEHIHDWLGMTVSDADESLVWFKEGFTEYLALWAAAATGLAPRAYFATRLLELEDIARSRSALGEVAFGDPTVAWRDGDGPLETLAYTGAPLLALLVDVELRASGTSAGLPALVAHLVAAGPRSIDLADVRDAFLALGLGDLWQRSVDGTHLPSVADLLPRAGFTLSDTPLDLAYVGLRTDDPWGGTVLALDPDGPAARAGVQLGDLITGLFPLRSPLANADACDTQYRFGLELIEPGADGAFLGVRRGDVDMKLPVAPRVLARAGVLRVWQEDAAALDRFFTWTP